MNQLPNLLIVDDTEENLMILEAMIRKINVNLIKAHSGQEALEITKGTDIALAIIDIWMPGMNGYELALKMNAERPGNKLPIIFLTASHIDEIEIFKGYDTGAVDYISKPVHNRVLLSKINVFLDLYNQKQIIIEDSLLLKESADELERLNEALRNSEEKYSELYDFAPIGYLTLSDECVIKELNQSATHMLGNDHSLLPGHLFDQYISRSTLPVFEAFFQNVFSSRNKEICEVILETANSQPQYIHMEGTVVGNGKQCFINIIDITERKVIEQTIRVSEEKYKTMLNASPDGILLIDLQGIITEASEIGLELIGADSRDDLVDKNILLLIPDDERSTIKELFERTMNEGLVQNIGMKIRKKNNILFAAEISVTLIQDPHGIPLSYMVIIRDISQRKKMETKQMHADRMASLGEMASGIAHEINQPLNIISLVMDKILFESSKNGTIDIDFFKNKSNKIFENITRIRNIIDHIRAFSRSHDDYILTAFDINASIENAISMITEQFKHLGINLNIQLEKQIPQILGNTYKFEQVIVNLLVNAKDAVIEKKNIKEEAIEMIVEIRSYQENRTLIVEINDNGIGISNDDIHNIMLPFYTTKEEGKGTGLGLSICYQIIKEMKGTIDITSDKFNGTKIKLVFNI